MLNGAQGRGEHQRCRQASHYTNAKEELPVSLADTEGQVGHRSAWVVSSGTFDG